jgi:enoyl-CoA hydratase
MAYSLILFQKNEHIARITLNRPLEDNVINLQLGQELEDACREVNQDNGIYVAVITGAGNVFCGGSELEKLFQSSRKRPGQEQIIKQYNVASAVAGIEKPVIAAINGDALGQGLEIALACDIRIAAQKARFGFPDVALGLIPMDGGTQRLPRIVGKGKALELILTAETINADEANEIGLVSQVVPAASLATATDAVVRSMSDKAPIALRYVKEAVNKGLDMTLEQGLRLEADLYFLLHTTDDRTEGINAFKQKRTPGFKGK